MLATFVLVLAAFMIAFAFLAFFVFATFMLFAFAFMFLATFVFAFFAAVRFWHVGLHLDHFLCHFDCFCSLILVEVIPVGEGIDQTILACHHFRAHARHLMMIAFMMFVALFFLVFAAALFAVAFFFLFVAA